MLIFQFSNAQMTTTSEKQRHIEDPPESTFTKMPATSKSTDIKIIGQSSATITGAKLP